MKIFLRKGLFQNWQRSAERIRRILLGGGVVLLLTLLFSLQFTFDQVSLREGDIAPEEIRAPRTIEYQDETETRLLRERAVQRVRPQYDENPFALVDALNAVTIVFKNILDPSYQAPSSSASVLLVPGPYPIRLDRKSVHLLQQSPLSTLGLMEELLQKALTQAMQENIYDTPEALSQSRQKVGNLVLALAREQGLAEKYHSIAVEIAKQAIRPNRLYNPERTTRLKQEQWRLVAPVRYPILRGEVIVHRGERVTAQHLDKLRALGLLRPPFDLKRAFFLALLWGVMVGAFSLYLLQYERKIFENLRHLFLLALIIVLSIGGLKAGWSLIGLKATSTATGYLSVLWIVTSSMLIAFLLHPHLGVTAGTLLAVGTCLSTEMDLRYAVTMVVSSLVGAYAVARIRDRSCLVRVVATVAGVNGLMALLWGGFWGDNRRDILQGLGWALASGVGSGLLFWLGVAVLEKPFGLITHLGLMELCDTNRPLLRRLLLEAPGTYHHSMVMAILAEAAAEAIGADGLLVRAMAYYHDIGKIRRPQFFVENQQFENIHERLNPSLSMLVITSHIRDGVELAREWGLPEPIIDGIREHHGTGLVTYFYHQALGEQGPSRALEEQFRYEGPKPRSRETAILMLADGVEAASRTLLKPTPDQVEKLVRNIVQGRLADGQLDECDLTFRDLEKIIQAFTRTLVGMLHSRVEYPSVPSSQESLHKVLVDALNHPCLDADTPQSEATPTEKIDEKSPSV